MDKDKPPVLSDVKCNEAVDSTPRYTMKWVDNWKRWLTFWDKFLGGSQ